MSLAAVIDSPNASKKIGEFDVAAKGKETKTTEDVQHPENEDVPTYFDVIPVYSPKGRIN